VSPGETVGLAEEDPFEIDVWRLSVVALFL